MSLSHCLRLCCVLMALGLLLGLAGEAKAQPTYNFTTLNVPGSSLPSHAYATGINALGQIVGWSATGAFLFENGNYTTLDVPGASSFTACLGINASGQIVGSYDVYDHGSLQRGFLATPVP